MSQATSERRQRILDELLNRRHVTVRALSRDLDVSEATVRRDLKALSDLRQVRLVHGGATMPAGGDFSFQAKRSRNVEAKKVIAALAAELIHDGDQVFLDSGTTCFEVGAHVRSKRDVSVLVNSARLALELNSPGLSVIMLGGQYRPERMDTVGAIALSTLEQLRGYQAFIGADGLSMEFGPSASDIDSAHLYRLAVSHARETVLLVDQSKFESPSLFRIVEWTQINRLVTNRRPEERWMEFLSSHHIQVLCPRDAEPPLEPDGPA